MARPKALDDTEIRWASLQRERGCRIDDIAAVLGVTRQTLYNEFKDKGFNNPKPLPDEYWLFYTT